MLSPSDATTQRFLSEAQTTAQVNHENIVIIHEVSESDGDPYMVLEYLDGENLREHMDGKALPAHRVIEIMIPVVRALARAHGHGIVHRDLKPENILLGKQGQIKVCDFGLAKFFANPEIEECTKEGLPTERNLSDSPISNLTAAGALLGTVPYMSPEQWGRGEVDHLSDLWAVGVMLFEMLAGRMPFEASNPVRLRFKVAIEKDPAPSIDELVPGIAPALADIVAACLEKEPSRRLGDARKLLHALEALLPGQTGRALAVGENPYLGLVAFQEQDAGRFFGRDRDIIRASRKFVNSL